MTEDGCREECECVIETGVSAPGDEVSFDPAQDRLFVSAKGPKTMLAVAWPLRVSSAVYRHRQRANSPGSNSARLFSAVGCTARPCHQARKAKGKS